MHTNQLFVYYPINPPDTKVTSAAAIIIFNGRYILHSKRVLTANHVKHYRLMAGITQKELAEKTGITRQTLSLIEKGDYNPSLKLCLNLCYALNQTLDTVFWVKPS